MGLPCTIVSLVLTWMVKTPVIVAQGGTVATNCTYTSNSAMLTYSGATPVGVVAINAATDEFQFTEVTATVTFNLEVKLNKTSEGDVVFDKDPNMALYTIRVQARFTNAAVQIDGDEEFVVQCSFEKYAEDVSSGSDVEESVSNPVLVSESVGERADSNFTVEVVKINEESFKDSFVHLGRIVKLKAEMTGTATETKFHVTSCKGFSTDMNSSIVLLSDGCGTGFPFKITEGFLLRGLSAISPSFRMFRIKQNQGVRFKCNFIICNSNCPENSCAQAATRRKRDTSHAEQMLENSNQVDQDALNPQDRELPRENQQPPMDEDKVEKILGVVMGNRKEIVNKVHQIPRGLIIDVADGPVLTLDSDEDQNNEEVISLKTQGDENPEYGISSRVSVWDDDSNSDGLSSVPNVEIVRSETKQMIVEDDVDLAPKLSLGVQQE